MKEYEIAFTYLIGCAGAAYPQNSFEEVAVANTDDYIRSKHRKEFDQFQKEVLPSGQIVYKFYNGAETYIYEFTEI